MHYKGDFQLLTRSGLEGVGDVVFHVRNGFSYNITKYRRNVDNMFILVQSKMKNIYIFEPEKFQISTK
jgi:hypothetical protein